MTQFKELPTDIVLVTWNRPKLTWQVLDAIKANTKRENYRLLVIDNGSQAEMVPEFLKRHEAGDIDQLILNKTNLGLEPARTQSLDHIQSRFFVCVDNDLLPPPPKDGVDWLEALVSIMKTNAEYGSIALRTQVMIGSGNIFDGKENQELVDFPHPGGSYRIMRTHAVRAVGGWSTRDSRGSEEKYICNKLTEQFGYKHAFTVQWKSLHLFGDKETDNWGYPQDWEPEKSGHTEVWHPIFAKGDDPEQIKRFLETGEYE